MGYEALACGLIMVSVTFGVLLFVRREARAMREALVRESDRIERKVLDVNGEARGLVGQALSSAARAAEAADRATNAGIMAGYAVTSAARAAQAAKRAEDAADRSTIASEDAAQRAQEAVHRVQEAGLWARLAGAARKTEND